MLYDLSVILIWNKLADNEDFISQEYSWLKLNIFI